MTPLEAAAVRARGPLTKVAGLLEELTTAPPHELIGELKEIPLDAIRDPLWALDQGVR